MVCFLDRHEVLHDLKDDVAEENETDSEGDERSGAVRRQRCDADDGPDNGEQQERPLFANERPPVSGFRDLEHIEHPRGIARTTTATVGSTTVAKIGVMMSE